MVIRVRYFDTYLACLVCCDIQSFCDTEGEKILGDAFIYDAVRTPRGKGKSSGSLYTTHPVQLLAQCLKALETRNGLDTSQVDDVVAGVVPYRAV